MKMSYKKLGFRAQEEWELKKSAGRPQRIKITTVSHGWEEARNQLLEVYCGAPLTAVLVGPTKSIKGKRPSCALKCVKVGPVTAPKVSPF